MESTKVQPGTQGMVETSFSPQNGYKKSVDADDPMLPPGSLTDTQGSTHNGIGPTVPKVDAARGTWQRKIDFLFACVGFSVGLGNIWRFPYLCYKNGGGAFLIPYFICVILCGVPMFYLEVSIGQFMSKGGVMVWNLCPLLQGIGAATTIIMFLVNVYYNVILAWTLFYIFSSFTTVLPWSHCNNTWNTPLCRDSWNRTEDLGISNDTIGFTETMLSKTNSTITGYFVNQSDANVTLEKTTDPVKEFWDHRVLGISSGIDDPGTVKWDLALCLLLAWILIYFCIWKGIKSSGKVMYFTAPAPYVFMLILLIRGVTLPGAWEGLSYYLTPDLSKLGDQSVWVGAGTQIFFSYSLGNGALTAVGSYNKFNHNSYRDCMIFAAVNSGTSILAGFVIFSVLGFMAHEQGVDISAVADSGPGLAFIAYPKAVSHMPFPPIWSILFFIMIMLLGLDSQFLGMESVVTAIVDSFPDQLRKGRRKELFILFMCFISFLVGLSMVTNGGVYVFQLFDYYAGSRIIIVVALIECITVAYIYGVKRYYDNLEMMLGYRINPIMHICWAVVTPLFTIVLFGLILYNYSEVTYNDYVYPSWAVGVGWSLATTSISMVPLVAAFKVSRTSGTFNQRLRKLLRPRLEKHQMRPCDDLKDLREELDVEQC